MHTLTLRLLISLGFSVVFLAIPAFGDEISDAQAQRFREMGGFNFLRGMAQGESDLGPPNAPEWERVLSRFGCAFTKQSEKMTSITVFCDENRVMSRIMYFQATGVLDHQTPVEVYEHLPQSTVARLVELASGIVLMKVEVTGETVELKGEYETVDESYARVLQPIFEGELHVDTFNNFSRSGDIRGALEFSGVHYDKEFTSSLDMEEEAFHDWVEQKLASLKQDK